LSDAPQPTDLLRTLIRFDTTNPPGNEGECVEYIAGLLRDAGCETRLVARDPSRPNLVARLRGSGAVPGLLLQGHVDVVTAAGQSWTHSPFAADLHGGFVWGRGALDMKGGVAMMVSAFLRLQSEGIVPPGDVVLCVLADEEAGGDNGARFLVEEHPELFSGLRWAIGEFGGFPFHALGRKFYPIQVAEKQMCWMKATVRGPGGHGSQPIRGGAMAKLGRLLRRLDRMHLPVHVTPVVREMIESMSAAAPFPTGSVLRQLLNPRLTEVTLGLLGSGGSAFRPLLHNTVSPTIVRGGDKINVIPGEVSVELDGRLLPGYGPQDMLAELHQVLGWDVEIDVLRYDPAPDRSDMSLFNVMADILRELDPAGVPIPLLLPAITDGRFFSRLGIQPYGFLPMDLPRDFHVMETIHAADERIPAQALAFGSNAIHLLLRRFGAAMTTDA
jgi:acetylornithine deacetylase/succinyl-diaminopimelate desuccinylase-like protein